MQEFNIIQLLYYLNINDNFRISDWAMYQVNKQFGIYLVGQCCAHFVAWESIDINDIVSALHFNVTLNNLFALLHRVANAR